MNMKAMVAGLVKQASDLLAMSGAMIEPLVPDHEAAIAKIPSLLNKLSSNGMLDPSDLEAYRVKLSSQTGALDVVEELATLFVQQQKIAAAKTGQESVKEAGEVGTPKYAEAATMPKPRASRFRQ